MGVEPSTGVVPCTEDRMSTPEPGGDGSKLFQDHSCWAMKFLGSAEWQSSLGWHFVVD